MYLQVYILRVHVFARTSACSTRLMNQETHPWNDGESPRSFNSMRRRGPWTVRVDEVETRWPSALAGRLMGEKSVRRVDSSPLGYFDRAILWNCLVARNILRVQGA